MNSTIKELMGQVNDLIKQAEEKMHDSHFCMEAQFEILRWEKVGKARRITIEGRPLIEHPFEVRCEHLEKLPFLVTAAKQAMLEKLSKITPERLTELSDMILDI